MRDAVGRTLGVIDETGTIIACSELSKIGEVISTASEVFADNELHYINGATFCNFGSHIQTEYAVFVDGTDELAGRLAAVSCVSLENLKQYYEEKFDRSNFIKNVILDNILPGDIYLKSRERGAAHPHHRSQRRGGLRFRAESLPGQDQGFHHQHQRA